jgi:hypothetical protein
MSKINKTNDLLPFPSRERTGTNRLASLRSRFPLSKRGTERERDYFRLGQSLKHRAIQTRNKLTFAHARGDSRSVQSASGFNSFLCGFLCRSVGRSTVPVFSLPANGAKYLEAVPPFRPVRTGHHVAQSRGQFGATPKEGYLTCLLAMVCKPRL